MSAAERWDPARVRRPTRLSGAVAVGAGLVAVSAGGFYSWIALAAGALGLLLVVVGLARAAPVVVSLGAVGLLACGLAAGVRGAPAWATLTSVAATVLAWDAGRTAISVGRQLGREADTRRLELVHAGASAAVAAVTAGVGYGLFRVATGGQPVAALVLFLLAAVLLVEAIR